ncbi:hypothetical protein [Dyella monticola]|uniref:hypothetical protein n=1 Tax=Dyella monticola TaxID=1927958 RepID=UPI0011C02377|nr:hypothetical protein [Dyella monticola]
MNEPLGISSRVSGIWNRNGNVTNADVIRHKGLAVAQWAACSGNAADYFVMQRAPLLHGGRIVGGRECLRERLLKQPAENDPSVAGRSRKPLLPMPVLQNPAT